MVRYSRYSRKIKNPILAAVALLIFSTLLLQSVLGTAYYSLIMDDYASVVSPPIVLQAGTVGTSTIYTNSTSAKVSTVALPSVSTYYPSSYNVVTGTHLSGSVPNSVQIVDTDYFTVNSAGTATSATSYNPSGYTLGGSTTLVSGTTEDLISNNSVYMVFRSYTSTTSAQPLYTHQDTTTINGSTYYLLKLVDADAAGTTLSDDAGTLGRKLMGKFVYPLTGISSIPASTWTVYYRASQDHVLVVSHCDVDILVRMSNGTIRSTIATHVANSADLTGTTSWVTLSGTYSWATYNIVDQTDYLEMDYYREVTTSKANYLVNLRIDDNTLTVADQTRATNINLPNQYTSEVEFTGSSNTQPWYQLFWRIDSAWTTDSVTVTVQVYNYTAGEYPTSGSGYSSYTSSATANTDEAKNQTITTNPAHFRNATGYWRIRIRGMKSTTSQFDFKADWLEFTPSHYSEYTVSTEFLFSSMTPNTPNQLNFTVVSEYDVSSVSVTIQVWNYSASSYATSGEGYLGYSSSGSNETKLLNINTNSQHFVSGGNAKIIVVGVLPTTIQYQQKINQIKLVYEYAAATSYDYVLRVNNTVTDSWQIRLKKYSDNNINRLQNCTIYFHNSTDGTSNQILIENGAFTQNVGPWYNLSSSATIYIAMMVEATSTGTSYVNAYLEILVPDTMVYAQYIITFEIT